MPAPMVLPAAVGTGAAAAPQPGCTVDDSRLDELSGLVVDPSGTQGYRAIVDGGGTARVFSVDPRSCAVTGERTVPVPVTDVEDLALGPDGTLWLADTGDNAVRRATVRLVGLPVSGPPRVYDLRYPDGPRDAEALVVSDDGVPLIVDKTTGAAGVYRTAGPLTASGRAGSAPVPLVRAAEVVLPWSETGGGPLGVAGSRTVTGGALSPRGASGRVVGLRTYTDAWLFRLPAEGPATADALVTALRGAPTPVPLPDEPQGEALALDARGTLHSGGEERGLEHAAIRTVPGAVAVATGPGAPVLAQPPAAPDVAVSGWSAATTGVAAVTAVALAGIAAMLAQTWFRTRRTRPPR
ncbi:SdiA-regulated/phytase-like domain-containing protein [Pseudonocardia phyllosphaerae]|uniref:hypothetical protein n=1 Tax=Pseudonocardia phyllosphaerae TaxID=3390502 RepID=UPI00397ADF30